MKQTTIRHTTLAILGVLLGIVHTGMSDSAQVWDSCRVNVANILCYALSDGLQGTNDDLTHKPALPEQVKAAKKKGVGFWNGNGRATHLRNIYTKLHVHSRSSAVAKAIKERLF